MANACEMIWRCFEHQDESIAWNVPIETPRGNEGYSGSGEMLCGPEIEAWVNELGEIVRRPDNGVSYCG